MRTQVTKNKARDGEVCVNQSGENLSPESMFCALLEVFNTPNSVLQAFPLNWQAASDWEIGLIHHSFCHIMH